ncbi:hypothetical protein GCM10010195_63940 [Kitasatospora griseola]|nr:hypothetical protein GCM10010195_63940 [Kitasatospora griseola]
MHWLPWYWLYWSIACGKVFAGSMLSFFISGPRSANTCEEQNLPTLSVLNEDTTSGASGPPARSACSLFSSEMFSRTLTWMFGCSFSKAATLSLIAFISESWFQPCQKVIVTSCPAAEPSSAPSELVPVQAEARTAVQSAAASAASGRRTSGELRVVSTDGTPDGGTDAGRWGPAPVRGEGRAGTCGSDVRAARTRSDGSGRCAARFSGC